MALSIGAVSAEFIANTKGFVDNINKAEKSVGKFTKNLGTTVKDVARFSVKIGAIISGVASVAGGFAIKNSAELQMLSSSFETLTGSIETGRQAYQDLVKMGAKTPFNTQDLAKATQTMLSFGISLEDTQKMLNVLGDVSLGNKEKLRGLSLAYAQVQSTGRLMGQDLLQMINQGFNPLLIISQKTGKSMSVLKKEMEDGAISADMVTDAFISATSEGGLFYKGMDKGSKTLSGTFSTLMDNITLMGTGLVGLAEDGTIVEGSLLSLVQKGVNFLNDRLGAIDWVETGKKIQNNLVFALNLLKSTFQSVTSTINNFWQTNKDRILPILETLKNVIIFISSTVLTMLFYAWERLREPVMNLWEAIKEFVTAITPLLQILALVLVPMVQIAFALMVNVIAGAVNGVAGILRLLVGVFNVIFGTIRGILTGDFSQAVNGFKQIFRGLGGWISGAIQLILSPFRSIADGIYNIFKSINLYRAGREMINGLINGVRSNISGLANTIKSGLKKIPGFDKIPGFADGVRNFEGGLAIVGEEGPELVNLPKGSDVFTNSETKDMMRGTGANITNNFTVNNLADAEYLSRRLALQLRTN